LWVISDKFRADKINHFKRECINNDDDDDDDDDKIIDMYLLTHETAAKVACFSADRTHRECAF
jgi:hypothetical protein